MPPVPKNELFGHRPQHWQRYFGNGVSLNPNDSLPSLSSIRLNSFRGQWTKRVRLFRLSIAMAWHCLSAYTPLLFLQCLLPPVTFSIIETPINYPCWLKTYLCISSFSSSNAPTEFTIREYDQIWIYYLSFALLVQIWITLLFIDGLWPDYNDGTWPACCSKSNFDEKQVLLLSLALGEFENLGLGFHLSL